MHSVGMRETQEDPLGGPSEAAGRTGNVGGALGGPLFSASIMCSEPPGLTLVQGKLFSSGSRNVSAFSPMRVHPGHQECMELSHPLP